MAKKGFELKTITRLISSDSDKPNWSLCVGAGISIPVFPSWYALAKNLANTLIPGSDLDEEMLTDLEFSADALIQMVKNKTKISDKDFAIKMSEILYSNFKEKIEPNDWPAIVKILEANHLSKITTKEWDIFNKYWDTVLKNTTSNVIAKSVFKAIEAGISPKSILSFNAEPLLLVMLNSLLMQSKTDEDHPIPKQLFNKVTGSLSNQNDKRIQYVFCHGLLPLSNKSDKFTYSTEKLVFSEEEYLQIANNSFSWQATTFINTCTTQHIIFIGTSLTDPNMRRWLSWTHSNRLNEMKEYNLNVEDSTQHYWIKEKPKNRDLMPWIESAVSHLGVRLIWLDSWSQAGEALELALGLRKREVAPKANKPYKKNSNNQQRRKTHSKKDNVKQRNNKKNEES